MIHEYLTRLRDIRKFVPKNVIDIGANTGNFTLKCKEIWPFSKYYMIEGNDECRFRLSMIGDPYYIKLLGDEDDKLVTFYKSKVSNTCTGNSIYREVTPAYDDDHVIIEKKKLITLDTLFKDQNIIFDFAKLDTQGSELDIMKGGIKTLSSCKYILIEVSLKYYNEGIPLKDDVVNYMASWGYINSEVISKHIWETFESMNGINYGDNFQEDIIFWK